MEKFNIKIDKPCAEDFKTFTKTAEGGFCNSCKKNVVDFTKMSDEEILNYFSTEKSKTCGIFIESQLKSYSAPSLSSNGTKSSSFVSSIFGISLLSLLSLTNAYSQEKNNTTPAVIKENIATTNNNVAVSSNEKITVSGVVSDKSGPLVGANIYLKNQNISTQTDMDGKFIFPKKLETGDVLLVTFIGFKTKEIKVTSENHSSIMNCAIKLDDYEVVMMGDVATTKVYQSKRTVFQKIKSLFTNE